MKLLISTLALGLAVTALPAAAEAHGCRHGVHHGHCVTTHRHFAYAHRHHWRYVHPYNAAGGPPPYYYPGYPAYPPVLFYYGQPQQFETPQPYGYANQFQWLVNAENDPPFAETPRYRWPGY